MKAVVVKCILNFIAKRWFARHLSDIVFGILLAESDDAVCKVGLQSVKDLTRKRHFVRG